MNDDNETYTLTLDDDITINLDSISSNTGTYSIIDSTMNLGDVWVNTTTTTDPTITIDNNSYEFYNTLNNYIDPDEVENMCKEYPALSKVWRNFKSVYDMTLQDYNGKKEQEKYT